MGINISRAIGPALAGFLIVGVGLAAPFLVNAISVVGIVAALWWWQSSGTAASTLPSEHVGGALRAGLRYAVYSNPLKATLVRAAAFFLFASAFWAMLPLIARDVLSGGATLYGMLLTAVGAGAVAGAFLLPTLKKRLSADALVAAGTIGTAAVLLIMATASSQVIAVAAATLAGLSWIAVLSSLNVSAQTSLPDWVRARGLSIFLTVFFGSMSLGSLLWGQIASISSIPTALITAAIGALVLIPLTWRARLGQGEALDLNPSMHWPEPVLADDATADGPVMIQVTYRIEQADRAAFQTLMTELAGSRRQGGGYRWSLMNDAAEPERFIETWWEASWLDHERHHARVTEESRKLQERIKALQAASTEPLLRHFVMPTASDRQGEA